jgi:hypothetical protein
MSAFVKSTLTVDGDTLHMSMPFVKVNKEARTVSGYATLNNIDSQGDVVTAEASKKAFDRARGNLREMHEKVAAGKVVKFREDEFLNPDDGQLYRGIFVTAYISKGAPNTWEKVLDGTLSGFSIGGEINDASTEFVKEAGKSIRFIKDYDLVELSLVDNPANQLANVFSIQKSATGSVTVKGMVVETQIESVFICKNDETVLINNEDSASCPKCEAKMENAGWFESGVGDRAEKVREIFTKFQTPSEAEATPESSNEGGVEMGTITIAKNDDGGVPEGTETDIVNPSEEFPDGEKVDENADVDETAGTEKVAESAAPEEVLDDETEISKKITELHDAVKTTLEKDREVTTEQFAELKNKIEEISKSLEPLATKTSELENKLTEFGEKLEVTKSRQVELEKSLDSLNSSDAFRKSADLEPEETVEKAQKNTWTPGAFSGKRPFSIDDHA